MQQKQVTCYYDFNCNSVHIEPIDSNFIVQVSTGQDAKKKKAKKRFAQVKDNWINHFLYETPHGLLINLFLLFSISVHYLFTISHKLQDEKFYREIIDSMYLTCTRQFFTIYLPLNALMHLVLITILYPLSRLSRSTRYYWLIGLTNVLIITCIAFFDINFTRTNFLIRTVLAIECTRLSMKVAAFLFECNGDEKVLQETNVTSFIYFLCIPHLIYKARYKPVKRRRWFRIVCHLWWLLIFVFPFGTFWFEHLVPWVTFDIAQGISSYISFAVHLGIVAFWGYFVIVWFFIFANYCSLHGELLKFADHRFMGTCNGALKGVEVASELNILASKWLARYCYVPIIEATASRFIALTFTFGVSSLWHELVFSYVYKQLCLINIPLAALAPILLANNKNTLFVKVKIFILFMTLLPVWAVIHPLEYMAWNHSSIPDMQQQSKWRLIPLFITYNVNYHFIPWINEQLKW